MGGIQQHRWLISQFLDNSGVVFKYKMPLTTRFEKGGEQSLP